MKKKTAVVLLSLLLSSVLLIAGTRAVFFEKETETRRVAASFYPIYIAAKNITQGAKNLELVNIAPTQGGCLHDFTLQPRHMVTLENADLLLINGAGMERFLTDIAETLPDLPVVDSSVSVNLLPEASEHDHEEAHGGEEDGHHDHGQWNAHLWMSPRRYRQQVENLCAGLIKRFPEDAVLFRRNTDAYLEKISELEQEITDSLQQAQGIPVVLFHDSFAYFADEFGMQIADTVEIEADTALNAGEIASIVSLVREKEIKILFAEEQYSTEAAESVARETGAVVYLLDTGVSGEDSPEAYCKAMRKNLEVVQTALQEAAGGENS